MSELRISDLEMRALKEFAPGDSPASAKLATLGPEGSSSEYVARLVSRLGGDREGFSIVLEDTYEQCLDSLANGSVDLVLVAHAYSGINAFYMNPALEPAFIFRGNTPEYGLATRPDFIFHEELLYSDTVVTHPAPIPLLEHHFDRPVKLVTVDSTSRAACDVADGLYNIAITNEEAVKKHNLNFVYRFSRIPMTWTVFSRRKDRNDHPDA
ncbi:type 2 periplasmic-binding domain-containing protein [Actinomadura rudentiformis]|uniref:Bacilysin biosynthesis protein BacA n=1 Tax=Actinomadura rudentiformis TaxID=359158 RepID=A0A6H9YY38_9ACTN|nr:bacilysin biosynthesis protein BacA [Actinomadura rudentiformis]KAB2345164.1 bacilysin biosynthesis protein BacA [Actinomadura rudentiformis]